ncbi:MAG: hypothetical protein HY335_00075, partial [Deinococcus sp.]|nr:hypothetical protein [Deinococcus sp.]
MPESAAYQSAFQFLMAHPDLERGTGAAELGLDTARRLLAALDNPQLAYPTILVAGTNG